MTPFRNWLMSGTAEAGTGAAPAPSSEASTNQTPASAAPAAAAPGGEGAASEAPGATAAAPAGKETEGGGASAAPSPPAQQTPGEAKDWRDRQIIKLRKQLEDARRGAPGSQVEVPAASGEDPQAAAARQNALIRAEAQKLAAAEKFQGQCVALAEEGRGAFPDFDARVGRLAGLVDKHNPAEVQSYANLIGAVIKTGAGAGLLHRLGGDLDTAERLLAMDPVDQALELVKISGKGQDTSNAPKPVTVIGGKGVTHEPVAPGDKSRSDSLSTAEWMARREKEVAERRKRA